MEVAGIVIGAIALIGVFEDCIELFSQIGAAKSMGNDYILLATRLDLQRALLLQWAERMNIYDEKTYDARLSETAVASPIYGALLCIRQLLQNGEVLQQRYGLGAAEAFQTEPPTTVCNSLMARMRDMSLTLNSRRSDSGRDFEQIESLHRSPGIVSKRKRSEPDRKLSQSGQAQLSHQQPDGHLQNKRPRYDTQRSWLEHPNHNLYEDKRGKPNLSKKIKWIIRDKDQFDSLVQKLSELISNIDRLVPPQRGNAPKYTILARDILAIKSVRELKKIMHASMIDNSELINIIQRAIDEACTQLIHDRLWFRLIDDRKNSIVDVHSRTFEWSIHPPTSAAVWDDLSGWLRSGRDIYWIYGKPGSGKSTLMKFLYYHPEVKSSLHEWAGDRKLTVASFFLWNIGAAEQSSQEGLARGLLYHVLKQNPLLTPTVLPYMWQEAQSGEVDLKLPSNSEMKTAFQQIGVQKTSGAFAFFIDGLDEFTGNNRDGISFVKGFITSANIKILLSSRPIDTCVAAFSSAPKLKLQDLTKADIATYINDVVRSHPYVCEEKCLSDAIVEGLVEDIQSKASGVFLWVVLACRTLIEGFEAFDDAEELRRRVDELPPELERLFRHILDGLPSRFIQQAAKLLRVCYISRLLQIESSISAFRLAWAHEKDMKPHALGEFTPASSDERKARCTLLQGRLRSRCRGLLEVSTSSNPSCDDLSVDFMHRSVFEFLSNPAVWELDCLQINDHEFEARTVLAYMSCYKLYLHMGTVPENDDVVSIASQYVREVEQNSLSNLTRLLDRFAYALMRPENISLSPFSSDSPLTESGLLLAIELDLNNVVHSHDLRKFNAIRKQHVLPSSPEWNLLYHAFQKPMTSKGARIKRSSICSPAMVNILVGAGCDPNESVALTGKDIRTCWASWMESIMHMSTPHFEGYHRKAELEDCPTPGFAVDVAEVTMIMIRAGAVLAVSDPHGHPEAWTTHIHIATKRYRTSLTQMTNLWLDFGAKYDAWRKLTAVCGEIREAVAASRELDCSLSLRNIHTNSESFRICRSLNDEDIDIQNETEQSTMEL
ncbi:unnamed protein product [Alternaria sp. RS040]